MNTTEPFVTEPDAFEVEVAIAELKRYKSTVVHEIPTELIQTEGERVLSEAHKLIKLIWRKKNCLNSEKSQLLYPFTRKAIKLIVVIIEAYHRC
jgi:hypothetical protein